MARKRPKASDVPMPLLICLDGGKPNGDSHALTPAEARALRRSAPLTHARLKEHLKGAGDDRSRQPGY